MYEDNFDMDEMQQTDSRVSQIVQQQAQPEEVKDQVVESGGTKVTLRGG